MPCRATRGAPAADEASICVAEGRWLAAAVLCVDRLRMAARGSGRRKRRLAVAPVGQARRTGGVSGKAQGGCIGPNSGGGNSKGGWQGVQSLPCGVAGARQAAARPVLR